MIQDVLNQEYWSTNRENPKTIPAVNSFEDRNDSLVYNSEHDHQTVEPQLESPVFSCLFSNLGGVACGHPDKSRESPNLKDRRIGAHRIQEPVILCEPQIMTSHKRLARVLTAGDGGFIR